MTPNYLAATGTGINLSPRLPAVPPSREAGKKETPSPRSKKLEGQAGSGRASPKVPDNLNQPLQPQPPKTPRGSLTLRKLNHTPKKVIHGDVSQNNTAKVINDASGSELIQIASRVFNNPVPVEQTDSMVVFRPTSPNVFLTSPKFPTTTSKSNESIVSRDTYSS